MVRDASSVVLGTHVNPDGDAIGSILGLGHALRRQGKQVGLICPSPAPEKFAFLPGYQAVALEWPGWEPDLIVVLDCSDRQRLAYLYKESIFTRVPTLNIDHHVTNERFATVNWVDSSMAATAEMLGTWFVEAGWSLDEPVASCLLTGLHTDSLGFRTTTTSPRTLRLAADLMDAGAVMAAIVERLYDSKPRSLLRLWGMALANMREEGPLVWAAITRDMLAQAGAEDESFNGIVGFMRSTADVEVAVLFSESSDGRIRTEFRSKGRVNVAEIAYRLGGGGHPPAAGCSLPGSLAEAEQIVLAAVRKALQIHE
jgi:phosphoesterase RecJ-like protein